MWDWTPRWDDVRFDHAAAASAGWACQRASAVVDDVRQRLARAAVAADEGWEGPHRRRADADLQRVAAALAAAREAIELARRGIADGAAAAVADQAGREAGRARWWAERHAEPRPRQGAG